jgi:hypothetical protein
MFVDDLRVRTGADGIVVGFVGVESERLIKGEVVPVAGITVPRCGYVPIGTVPEPYVFGMSAFPRAGVGVQFRNIKVIEGCDGAVVQAGDAWILIARCFCVKNVFDLDQNASNYKRIRTFAKL